MFTAGIFRLQINVELMMVGEERYEALGRQSTNPTSPLQSTPLSQPVTYMSSVFLISLFLLFPYFLFHLFFPFLIAPSLSLLIIIFVPLLVLLSTFHNSSILFHFPFFLPPLTLFIFTLPFLPSFYIFSTYVSFYSSLQYSGSILLQLL